MSFLNKSESAARVRVWDLPVRLFHWSIVMLLIGLVVTGKLGGDWLLWHMRFGQAMLALVLFRVIWGFVGSHNARFKSFLHGPVVVMRHLRSFLRRPRDPHVTHTPLGGWMVIALLIALLAQATMGLFTNDDAQWGGPLSERVTKATSDAISWYHRRFAWVIVALSSLHIAAVLSYLALHKQNLTAAMLTGAKLLPAGVGDDKDAAASTGKAIVLLALCGVGVWYLLHRL